MFIFQSTGEKYYYVTAIFLDRKTEYTGGIYEIPAELAKAVIDADSVQKAGELLRDRGDTWVLVSAKIKNKDIPLTKADFRKAFTQDEKDFDGTQKSFVIIGIIPENTLKTKMDISPRTVDNSKTITH